MRVIGGEYRGRRLQRAGGGHVRPTSDRVREAIFDILFSLGGVEGLLVADLFAGTGALGIEALSRGAASVTFVDRDPASIDAVRANLTSAGPGRRRGDRGRHRRPGRRRRLGGATASRYDLALCDPPYAYDGWESLVARLPADLVVLESGAELPPVPGWEVLRSKRYGGTIVTVARPERASQKGVS